MYRLPVCVCLIRRMSPCALTFHITTLARAGPQGGAAAGQAPGAVPLSAQHHQAGGPHPHPLQSKDKHTPPSPHFTEAPAMATCILPHTPAGAFSRMCPEPALNGCLPTPPHGVRAWGVSPAHPAARQDGDWETEADQQSPGPHPAQGVELTLPAQTQALRPLLGRPCFLRVSL